MDRRLRACIQRLEITEELALLILNRDVEACKLAVESLSHAWERCNEDNICPPTFDNEGNQINDGCVHLSRLWSARVYLALAEVGAPAEGAWGCDCGGSGKYYGHGVVENGVFKGFVGTCFRCKGKGWQDASDRSRNETYDNKYRRI
jgi:hypothetical protein